MTLAVFKRASELLAADEVAGRGSVRLNWHRLHAGEVLYWIAAVAVYFLLPQYLAFASTVLVASLFVMSLDLILGFAGIISLGHALYFGFGAYVTGLATFIGWTEPITGTLLGGVSAAALAGITGPIVLRLTGLPLIMVTLALNVIAFEAANKLTWLTGGDDGLFGIQVAPVFGIFPWNMFSQTAYLYVLAWLFLMFLLARAVVASPFGVALQGIRDNSLRMRLIGTPVLGNLVRIYIVSGFIAGVAGALSAQTTKFVGLSVISLDTSVSTLVMLVLGGVGRLYGGLIGAPVYMIVHHFASQWNPYHWMFIIGGLLAVVVMFARGGILGMVDFGHGLARAAAGKFRMSDVVLATAQLSKRFGALVASNNIDLELRAGERRALIGPNGAGKTTFVGLLSGTLRPDSGTITLLGRDITREPAARRVKAGLVRTFQITSLFRSLSVLENTYLAASEQLGTARQMLRPAASHRNVMARAEEVVATLGLADERHRKISELAYGRQRLVEIAVALCLEPKVLVLDEPAAGIPSDQAALLLDVIERLPAEMAILMIEHDMQVVRRFASKVTVFVGGAVLMTGSPHEVMSNEQVRSVYLGQSGHERFAATSLRA